MTTRSTKVLTTLPLLLLLLAGSAGCLFNPPTGDGTTPQESYEPYYDPDPIVAMDNLVTNFRIAWERMDIAEYRDNILYDGIDLAPDGEAYAPFTFYFDQAGAEPGQTFPDSEDYFREVERATNMFSGQPGENPVDGSEVPGIQSIALDLTADGIWADPADPDHVEGDAYPEGTKVRFYHTNMNITLQSNIGDSNINAWLVQDRLRFHLIPVQVEDEDNPGTFLTVYKLWKWRDIIGL